jgi:hypothetical protein
MKNRTVIVTLLVLAIGTVAMLYYLKHLGEPRYHGKRLRVWLAEGVRKWYESGDEACKPSREAVRHMGTNAIPTLLRMLRATDSPLNLKLVALADKIEFIPRPDTASDEHYLASWGFGWLGSDASNAIPALTDIYHQNILESSPIAYGILLDMAPPLERTVLVNEGQTNRYDYVRKLALWQLTPTNTPEVSVPLLIKALADPSPMIQSMAVSKLHFFGTNALPAVPALVPIAIGSGLGSTSAKSLLCKLDPETAVKALTNGFYTYQYYTNAQALNKARDEARTNGGSLDKVYNQFPPTLTNESEAMERFRQRYGILPPTNSILK